MDIVTTAHLMAPGIDTHVVNVRVPLASALTLTGFPPHRTHRIPAL